MDIVNVKANTPEWLSLRFRHYCASSAPIVFGVSKNTKRTDLLRMLALGDEKEFSQWTQDNLLNKGHEIEAKARPIVEAMLGSKLAPVVGVSGKYLASLDGRTEDETIIWECKSWSEDLAEQVRTNNLGPEYYWQLEHQLGVFKDKANRVFFTVTDGTKEKFEHMVYLPVPGRREKLQQAWAQFAQDLKDYQHVEAKPEAVGKDIEALPALSIQLVGEVKASNLAVYKGAALAFVQAINTNLQTDNDFADAEKAVKFCDRAEKELELVKAQAIGQTVSIDELFRTVDQLREAMRSKRLELTKLVEARKVAIRAEIKADAETALKDHIGVLEARLGVRLPETSAAFAEAMRGKKTVSSLQDGVNTELARVKIEVNELSERIYANLDLLANAEHTFLFADKQQLVLKDKESLQAIIQNRIAAHEKAEADKLEAERAKIREEERIKAEKAAEQKAPAVEQTFIPKAADPIAMPKGTSKGKKPIRPTDQAIIKVVQDFFQVSAADATDWLRTINFNNL